MSHNPEYNFVKLPHWILPKIGKLFSAFGIVTLYNPQIFGPIENLKLSPGVCPSNTLFNLCGGKIIVGEGSYFGHNCMVLIGYHISRDVGISEGRDIIIGKDCWICSGSIILGNVHIGDHSIIAAGAIVTKNVPPSSKIFGVW